MKTKPTVVTFVDGRRDAAEDSVKPFGVIRYEFRFMGDVAVWAIERCRALSPIKSGKYRQSWFVMAGGKEVDPANVGAADQIIITNDQPYHKKLELTVNSQRLHGGKKTIRVPAGIVEAVRQELLRKFPGVAAEVSFIELAGGYVLKGYGSRRRRAAATSRRKDARAGQPVTYPALIISSL